MNCFSRFSATLALATGVSLGVYGQALSGNDVQTGRQAILRKSAVPEILVQSAGYTNGTFVGRQENAYYGTVQVEAIINGGNIVDVRFLQYPNDNGTSRYINSIAIPNLKQEAIQAQGSHVSLVSGATYTSLAFHNSLHTALLQAVN